MLYGESPVEKSKRMVKLTPAERVEAYYWFEQYFNLGFFGRQFLHLKNIRLAIGYKGSDQSFSKLWISWLMKKLKEQSEDFRAQLDALNQRVADAIAEQESKEGNDNG